MLTGCNKDTLPDATDTGAGTCGMLVNGKVWESHKMGSFFQISGLGAIIIHIKKESTFLISGFSGNETLTMFFTVNNIGKYHFDNSFKQQPDSLSSNTSFVIDTISYQLTDTLQSEIEITRYDTVVNIISGTFSMNLFNFKGQELRITEGRFDLRYNP